MKSEVLVIGGGVAGSTAAALLARAGREVVLVEKSQGPAHKVCGEFLSHEALSYLQAAGVSPLALGAVVIDRVRLLGARGVSAEALLPFRALSLPRYALDEALLGAASEAGARVLRGVGAERLEGCVGSYTANLSGDAQPLHAQTVFLATGKHDLRAHGRPRGAQNSLVAFKMYFALRPEAAAQLGSAVELALYPGGYTGLQPVGGDQANLCALVEQKRFRALGGTWSALLAHLGRYAPALAERLRGAEPVWSRPLALSSIPYGLLAPRHADELWRVGDQTAVIPSFAGEGISLALHTAHRAAASFLDGKSPSAYAGQLRRELGGQMWRAVLVSQALVGMPAVAESAVRVWPGLLRNLARRTRIEAQASVAAAQAG